jgi:uncharacterized protein YaeQ
VRAEQLSSVAAVTIGATLYHFKLTLSDVERGVYEALDLRLAQHPSETLRYLVTRAFAYALSYEPGIAFSKGGVSSSEEPAVSVRDPTGALLAWIEVGVPSATRLHKAAKAAARVAVFTSDSIAALAAEAREGAIHRAHAIEIWKLDPPLLDAVVARVERRLEFELVRTEGQLYVTIRGEVLAGSIERSFLADTG